jgi:hypothetical protein
VNTRQKSALLSIGTTSYSINSQEGENRDNSQTQEEKDAKPIEPENQDGEKLGKQTLFSNFVSGNLERNPQSDVRIQTKTFNDRWHAVNELTSTDPEGLNKKNFGIWTQFN